MAFRRNINSIWIMDLRTHAIRCVGNYGNALHPTWSPDGRRLAFQGESGEPATYGIWIVNRDGSGLHKLPGGNYMDQFPLWAPDGREIVWTHGEQLWIADTSGANMRPLTSAPSRQFEFPCSWSSDGDTLLYAATDGGPDCELRLIDRNGSNQRRDPTGITVTTSARWSWDGKFIYRSLWSTQSGIAITEHRRDGATRHVPITGADVGTMAIAKDQSFMVFDAAPDPDADERIYYVRLK